MRAVQPGQFVLAASQSLVPLASPPALSDAVAVIRENRDLLPAVTSLPSGHDYRNVIIERSPIFPRFSWGRYVRDVAKTLVVAPPLTVVGAAALLTAVTDSESLRDILEPLLIGTAAVSPVLAALPQLQWKALTGGSLSERRLARLVPAHGLYALAAAIVDHPEAVLAPGQHPKLLAAQLLEQAFLSRADQCQTDRSLAGQLKEVYLILGNQRIADMISQMGAAAEIMDQAYLPELVQEALRGDVIAFRKVHSFHRESRPFQTGLAADDLTAEQRSQLGLEGTPKPRLSRRLADEGYRAEALESLRTFMSPKRPMDRPHSPVVTQSVSMTIASDDRLQRLAGRLIDLNPELALEVGGKEHELALTPNYRPPLPPVIGSWLAVGKRSVKFFPVIFMGIMIALFASGSNEGILADIGDSMIDEILGPLRPGQSPAQAWSAKILGLSAITATSAALLPRLGPGAVRRLAAAWEGRRLTVGYKASHLLAPPVLMQIARGVVEREDARLPRGADRAALMAAFTSAEG